MYDPKEVIDDIESAMGKITEVKRRLSILAFALDIWIIGASVFDTLTGRRNNMNALRTIQKELEKLVKCL